MEETNLTAIAIFGWALGMETLGALLSKRVITVDEAAEAIDRCILNFETQSAKAGADIAALAIARQIGELALAQIVAQDRTQP